MTNFLSYVKFRVKNFSPAWFAMTMGLGMASSILYTYPYEAKWLTNLAIVFYYLNIVLYLIFTIIFIARFLLFKDHFSHVFTDCRQCCTLGCIPMGLETLVLMTHYLWGDDVLNITVAIWWIGVVMSLFCAWGIFFIIFAMPSHSDKSMNATLLLPVVTLIVASTVGATLTASMPIELHKTTLVICFMMWANGEMLALSIMSIYIWRLIHYNLVDRSLTFTSMLPVGPLGQGACSILEQSKSFALISDDHPATPLVKYGSITIAIFLLSYASFWMAIVVLTVCYRPPQEFTMTWWGLTFPLGTWALAWKAIGEDVDSSALRIAGALFGAVEVLFTLLCLSCSLYFGFFKSGIFDMYASDYEKEQQPTSLAFEI